MRDNIHRGYTYNKMNLDFEGSFGEIIYGKTIYKLPKQLNTVISFEREDDFPLTHSINKQDRI